MKIGLTILGYLKWHYGKALQSLSRVWKIFLSFIWNFFSLSLLFRNFFDPWKRLDDPYPKSFNFKKYFYAFITNFIVRVVGMLLRTVLIIAGLICYILLALLYPLVIIGWILLPLITMIIMILGLFLIFK